MATLEEERQAVRTWLADRKQAYVLTFANAAGQRVLQDLMQFCRGGLTQTTFHADPRKSAALEGRREVYNRIRAHLELPLDDLVEAWAPLAAAQAPQEDEDEVP